MNAKPIIAFENLFAEGTLSSSGDEQGFPKENAADFRRYTLWKGAAIGGGPYVEVELASSDSINCVAILNHNAYSQSVSEIRVQYYDGSFQNADAWAPASDQDVFRTFAAKSSTKFRVHFYGTSPSVQAGIVMLGSCIQFPVYPEQGFDPDGQEKITTPQYSRTGQLLGLVTEYTARRINVNFRNLPQSFIDNQFMPFWNNHVPKPFIWAWDVTNHPDQAYWLALNKAELNMPYQGIARSLSLDLQGAAE